jgi:predicted nucleotidyltransferase
VKPRQVFLLGSAARGQMHDNSDIDLCRMDCIVAKRRNKYIVI